LDSSRCLIIDHELNTEARRLRNGFSHLVKKLCRSWVNRNPHGPHGWSICLDYGIGLRKSFNYKKPETSDLRVRRQRICLSTFQSFTEPVGRIQVSKCTWPILHWCPNLDCGVSKTKFLWPLRPCPYKKYSIQVSKFPRAHNQLIIGSIFLVQCGFHTKKCTSNIEVSTFWTPKCSRRRWPWV
jgi:hypothetical protein